MNLSLNEVSQFAHVGWGFLLVTALALLFHVRLDHAVELVTAGAGIKEYADAHGLETPAVAGSSWEDFAFWCVGIALAAGVIR